ncbi:MAG: hypothetical protein DWQ31_06620 [Planctomycetota bacterium]|nr:MAG: hypothetical protein DWQ31_06620 [Planctomycetota bacterium]REJ90351.1 MAG: hypothetical protein DWQ35_16885 [Planctomycetota bacterium]
MLEGYRIGLFRRNEIRIFAALCEAAALHQDSPVSLYRIVNCQSKNKGNRRLSHANINAARTKLNDLLPQLQTELATLPEEDRPTTTKKPVARRVLRHIAQGGATTVEALFYFAFFIRRIPQRKPMQRLKSDEHYARFRYAEFQLWTGVHRATQSRLLQRIIRRGYLNTAPVHKQNENAYGQLFIDGPMLSLVRRQQHARRAQRSLSTTTPSEREKRSTDVEVMVNAPPQKRSTLINRNPRTEIKRPENSVLDLRESLFAGHADPDLRRIAMRAAQMKGQYLQQAA